MYQLPKHKDPVFISDSTTLGPYSFRIFVDATFTEQNTGGKMPIGPRRGTKIGRTTIKRPRAEKIDKEYSSGRMQKAKIQINNQDEPEASTSDQKGRRPSSDEEDLEKRSNNNGRVTRSRK